MGIARRNASGGWSRDAVQEARHTFDIISRWPRIKVALAAGYGSAKGLGDPQSHSEWRALVVMVSVSSADCDASAKRRSGGQVLSVRRVRQAHPVFGGALLAAFGDPQSTTVWHTGAMGEENLGRRLNDRASEQLRLLHDRRIPAPAPTSTTSPSRRRGSTSSTRSATTVAGTSASPACSSPEPSCSTSQVGTRRGSSRACSARSRWCVPRSPTTPCPSPACSAAARHITLSGSRTTARPRRASRR